MIAQGAQIAEEYYFSILLDRANRTYLAMCGVEGGMDIETRAVERPEALAKVAVDPNIGIDAAKAAEIVGRPASMPRQGPRSLRCSSALGGLPRRGRDPGEVNPLVKTAAGASSPWTAKSLSTRTPISGTPITRRLSTTTKTDPLEVLAIERGLNYVKLDGDVGIIGNGAGLVMSARRRGVCRRGRSPFPDGGHPAPANFLDIGGGANADVMANGLDVILSDAQVKAVFVNVFGGSRPATRSRTGSRHTGSSPVTVGTQAAGGAPGRQQRRAGSADLDDAALPKLERVDTMDGAARRVAPNSLATAH